MRLTISQLKQNIVRFLSLLAAAALLGTSGAAQSPASASLRPNDKIEVRVFQEDDLTQQVVVAADGGVRLPLVGMISVGGLTADQAALQIRRAYANGYLVNPQVSVAVVAAAKRRLVVNGQVARPNTVEIRAGERLTLVQAIAEVGGMTRLANQRAVYVKRAIGGREQIFKVDYKAMATNPAIPPFYVQEGDIITVKESIF